MSAIGNPRTDHKISGDTTSRALLLKATHATAMSHARHSPWHQPFGNRIGILIVSVDSNNCAKKAYSVIFYARQFLL